VAAIAVGDHIARINGTDLTGCRHFEVARMLKEIPIGSEFTLICVEPKKSFGISLLPASATISPLWLRSQLRLLFCVETKLPDVAPSQPPPSPTWLPAQARRRSA
jgi:hypothetical protein